ncbi:MAG: EscU/YscU/HrcU family type III secretion system export apparatus switch protein, partial [Pseudomonadota bacterium]
MADDTDDSEKTEDPTQKRLKEAHDKGDVPKSQEVSTWFTLAGATLMIALFAPGAAASLGDLMKGYIEHAHQISVDGFALKALWRDTGQSVALIVGLPLIALLVMAVAGNLIQHQPLLTAETIKPKLSKISPLSGFKRLFSADSLVNFAKGMFKISIVGALMVAVVWPHRDEAEIIIFAETSVILEEAQVLILQLLAAVLLVGVIRRCDDGHDRKN